MSMGMGLWQMSFYGAVLILVVAVLRTLLVNYLPKRTFILLWCVVLARLLVPFEVSSAFSVYSLTGYDVGEKLPFRSIRAEMEDLLGLGSGLEVGDLLGLGAESEAGENADGSAETGKDRDARGMGLKQARDTTLTSRVNSGRDAGADRNVQDSQSIDGPAGAGQGMTQNMGTEQGADQNMTLNMEAAQSTGKNMAEDAGQDLDRKRDWIVEGSFEQTALSGWLPGIWGIGAAVCAGFFIVAYGRCRREFGMSLPVDNDYISRWMEERCAERSTSCRVDVRVSDRIDTPLTYRVIRPVILLPKKTAWEDTEALAYILWHEYLHIRHGDALLKLAAAAALCIHWFNPLVWLMYFLLNRDIELACDESVVRRCGVGDRGAYANMLIGMEARRSGVMPFCNNFSQNAIEERIRAIMKIKKITLGAGLFAAGLAMGVTTVFATSASGDSRRSARQKEVQEAGTREEVQEAEMQEEEIQEETQGEKIQGEKLQAEHARLDSAEKTKTGTFAELTSAGPVFTKEEYDKLLALQFDGYEDMTVSEYQRRVWTLTDTDDYRELLERFSQNEEFYEKKEENEAANFLFH